MVGVSIGLASGEDNGLWWKPKETRGYMSKKRSEEEDTSNNRSTLGLPGNPTSQRSYYHPHITMQTTPSMVMNPWQTLGKPKLPYVHFSQAWWRHLNSQLHPGAQGQLGNTEKSNFFFKKQILYCMYFYRAV